MNAPNAAVLLLLVFVMARRSAAADDKKEEEQWAQVEEEEGSEEQPTEDNSEGDALVIFETILNGEKEITKNEGMIVTSDGDDNNESADDDDVEDNDEDEDEIDEDISSDPPKPLVQDMQIRRQGYLYPDFEKKEMDGGSYFQQRQDAHDPHASPFDSSPLLHLTRGGYHRSPYGGSGRGPFDVQRQNSPEQSERPVGTQSDLPQIVPQVTYTSAYRPHMDEGTVPPVRHRPLDSFGPLLNTNGVVTNGASNGFFGAQPSPYPVFTSSNIQSPFAPRGFSDALRDEMSQYQVPSMVNSHLLFGSPPQFVETQSPTDPLQRPALNSFQTSSFNPYAGMNDVADSLRPDYYTYFRSPLAMNLPQFQGNPNFYNALPAAFNTPPSRFSGYPVAGSPIAPPNTNPQQDRKQHQNSEETAVSDKKSQDPSSSDQIDESSDKENPVVLSGVPFGTRVSPPGDVYIRYPTKEAGYATEEENLPSQNATTLLKKSRDPFTMYSPEGGPFFAPLRSPIVLPDRKYPFSAVSPQRTSDRVTPACAKDTNSSFCFKDPEYPRRELLYALNSDSSFLLERLAASDQRLEDIPLVEGEGGSEKEGKYVCKAHLTYGTPLRAMNVQGAWKVVVNVERAIGGGKFVQPVRLEVCSGGAIGGDPCSLATDLRTRCVQKYSLQRLLSWSADKGVHDDVYRLPLACSCQVVTPDH